MRPYLLLLSSLLEISHFLSEIDQPFRATFGPDPTLLFKRYDRVDVLLLIDTVDSLSSSKLSESDEFARASLTGCLFCQETDRSAIVIEDPPLALHKRTERGDHRAAEFKQN